MTVKIGNMQGVRFGMSVVVYDPVEGGHARRVKVRSDCGDERWVQLRALRWKSANGGCRACARAGKAPQPEPPRAA